ncbi:MAG: tetratricopeptide repeat protein [Kiritimatiellae bacterium]|nr:tetratricopeptide repeat protein [Kiritimatiellia bacterium]
MKMKSLILKIIFVSMLFLVVLPVCAAESEKAAKELLDQGNELFRQANELAISDVESARDLYGKAIMRFEKVVNDYGIENGKLFYNIGNTYFRMEDVGNAILNYRRAELYMPSDVNLVKNLHYAQARRVDSFEEQQSTRVLKTLFFWHYDFSAKTRGILFGVMFAFLWLFSTVRLFIRRPYLNWLIGAFVILSFFLFGSLMADYVQARLVKPGVIIVREVIARKGDSKTYEPTFKQPLHAGTEFVLKEDRGTWVQVELTDGTQCWLPSDSVGLVNPPSPRLRRTSSEK